MVRNKNKKSNIKIQMIFSIDFPFYIHFCFAYPFLFAAFSKFHMNLNRHSSIFYSYRSASAGLASAALMA